MDLQSVAQKALLERSELEMFCWRALLESYSSLAVNCWRIPSYSATAWVPELYSALEAYRLQLYCECGWQNSNSHLLGLRSD